MECRNKKQNEEEKKNYGYQEKDDGDDDDDDEGEEKMIVNKRMRRGEWQRQDGHRKPIVAVERIQDEEKVTRNN